MTLPNTPTELISKQDSSHLLFVSLQSVFIDIARGDWIFWSINQLNVDIYNYFDIPKNTWNLNGFEEVMKKGQEECLQIRWVLGGVRTLGYGGVSLVGLSF